MKTLFAVVAIVMALVGPASRAQEKIETLANSHELSVLMFPGLTPIQEQAIVGLRREWQNEIRMLDQSSPEFVAQQAENLTDYYEAKALALLTEAQLARFEELKKSQGVEKLLFGTIGC